MPRERRAAVPPAAGAAAVRRALLALLLLLLPACSEDEPGPTLTVFAAASLSDSFPALGRAYEAAHPGSRVVFSFAGSQTLVAQVQQGAPADVLVTADAATAEQVRDELAAPPRLLARNRLAIVTEPGNPLGIPTLRDLARPGVRVVLAGPTVPVGKAARAALAEASVTVRPVSEEPDVKAVVQRVRLGEADAGIAYATDLVAAKDQVGGTPLPGVSNVLPGAVLRSSGQAEAATRFLDLVLSPEGQRVLGTYGFLPP